jgi:hypothetical protein
MKERETDISLVARTGKLLIVRLENMCMLSD